MEFRKLNDSPLDIEYVEPTEDDRDAYGIADDWTPSFVFDGVRYYLDQFARIGTPWVSSDGIPSHIHGVQMDVHYNPLYVQIVRDGDAVNVYENTEWGF